MRDRTSRVRGTLEARAAAAAWRRGRVTSAVVVSTATVHRQHSSTRARGQGGPPADAYGRVHHRARVCWAGACALPADREAGTLAARRPLEFDGRMSARARENLWPSYGVLLGAVTASVAVQGAMPPSGAQEVLVNALLGVSLIQAFHIARTSRVLVALAYVVVI